ncbi:hypothetical protein [Aristaeella hokkaidonensis]|uniref:Uncharacterized protein n=1 Tax=Aristaeella hokkaidonensis TaxID=3046382 RepID=A0AC61NMQ3_9FIRM|nr:hypothetical protein [Aristaeella hokkaidonensis]QUC68303.1 hypothetical protein JYE49_06305 [Aristaeella hokkaidonensis]SNT95305.1 hypothetical protein SAMN06297421_11225 [Aristaeella hokkaidonensis]
MAKNMLKSLGRFELLELIYTMRKENLELKERCEAAERKVAEIREQTDKQLDYARRDYENRIEELRMQGAAKDLQIRMKKIEEQLRLLQKLTMVDIDLPELPTEEEIEQAAKQEEKEPEAETDAPEEDGKTE